MIETKHEQKNLKAQLVACLLYLLPFLWFQLTGIWFFQTTGKVQIAEKIFRYGWLSILPAGLIIGLLRKETRLMTIKMILGYFVLMFFMQITLCPTLWSQINHVFTKFAECS